MKMILKPENHTEEYLRSSYQERNQTSKTLI